ncbi:MAG TPA: hypothetical protein VJB06_03275, partial [archaeon]|nr:hypothetical protein [archaeon]
MVYSVYLAGSLPKGKEEEAKFTDWREGFHSLIAKMLSDQKINLKITCLDPNTAKYGSMPTEKFFGRDVHM